MRVGDDDLKFFPVGLKVLVVDDDPFCLTVLEKMLRDCSYTVTTCSRAITALSLLRERKDAFDVVISDVHMPDMDGFKLLELIGLTQGRNGIDMMSANGETDVVMKGVLYGACDYLVKPVRIEELRNIWQHVVRRRGMKEAVTYRDELAGSDEWEDLMKFSTRENEPQDGSFMKRKRRLSESDEQQLSVNTSKKARVVWSVELHQQFVKAINHLGIDKAVPKRILEVMNIQGLTRENVASHLQKYRLYLKRLSGVTPEPFPIASFQAYDSGAPFGGTMQIQSHPAARTGSLLRTKSGPADLGTLETLKQLQALQQAAHEKGKIEAGLVDVTYSPIPVARSLDFASGRLGPERMASVDPPKSYDLQNTSSDVIELEGRLDFDNEDELFR